MHLEPKRAAPGPHHTGLGTRLDTATLTREQWPAMVASQNVAQVLRSRAMETFSDALPASRWRKPYKDRNYSLSRYIASKRDVTSSFLKVFVFNSWRFIIPTEDLIFP